jgi:hypothetical protein
MAKLKTSKSNINCPESVTSRYYDLILGGFMDDKEAEIQAIWENCQDYLVQKYGESEIRTWWVYREFGPLK